MNKKITFILLSFLFATSTAFSNNETYFFENDIFTVVNRTINSSSALFMSKDAAFNQNIFSDSVASETPGNLSVKTPSNAGKTSAESTYLSSFASSITFSKAFTNGQSSTANCNAWTTFQSQLLSTKPYTKLTIKGSKDPVGVSVTDPAKVLQLANAMRTGATISITDGGRTWRTGNCGSGIELTVSGGICRCDTSYTVRPCINNNNPNWGGAGTSTCSAPSQTLIVEFELNGGTVSANGNLSALTSTAGAINPIFAAGTANYTASVANGTTSITVTPTKADANATIKVNGQTVSSGAASGSIALSVGSNTITTIVTAQDASTKTYTLTVTRAASANGNLSILALSSGTLSPAFTAGTTNYTASVANGTTSITVTPTKADANATIKVNGQTVSSGAASGSIALSVGSNTITTIVTAQDASTKTYTVAVIRRGPPTITTTDVVSTIDEGLTALGSVSADETVTWSVTGTGVLIDTEGVLTLDAAAVFGTTYTFRITANSSTTTDPISVTVNDITDPVLTVADININTDAGVCGAEITFGAFGVTATDNSGEVDITYSKVDGAIFPVGITPVEATATDSSGNFVKAYFDVVVVDNEAPVTLVLADVTDECTAAATAPTTTDNCAGIITGTTSDPLTYAVQGTHEITWSFDDGNGNVITVKQNVIVNDTTAPNTPTLADVTGQCSATAAVPTTTDNCAGTINGTTSNATTYNTQGTHVITWSFDDGNGNVITANQNVIVNDTTDPNMPTLADVTGQCDATAAVPTTTDNCVGTINGTTSDPLTYATQGTHIITWSFDDGNGNIITANQNVIVNDTTDPNMPTLADVTGQCDATAAVPTTTDNCVGIINGTTTDSLIYTTQGTYEIIWSFDDGNGNVITANQNVIIEDNIYPTITLTGAASVTHDAFATYTDAGATATDNCSTPTVIIGGTVNTNLPGVYTLTYDAIDASGNAATQVTRTVTVVDNTPPTIITQNITVNLDSNGAASITPQQIDNGSSDTSGPVTLSLDNTNFSCADIGSGCAPGTGLDFSGPNDYVRIPNVYNTFNKELTVNWWVNFQNNSAWFTQSTFNSDNMGTNVWLMHQGAGNGLTWYVNDGGSWRAVSYNGSPGWHLVTGVADATSTRLYWDGVLVGNTTGIVSQIRNNPNSEITIGIDGRIPSRNANFQADEASVWNRALTAIEIQDLHSSCADVNDPNLVGYWKMNEGSGLTVTDSSPTGANGTLVNMNATSSWVTSGVNFTMGGNNNVVTLTATDANNNSASATATVTVVDITAPIITLNGLATETVNAYAPYTDAGASATDNCDTSTVTVGGTVNVNLPGVYTLTYDAADASGNIATQVTRTITVVDNTPPTVITKNITVNLDANGNASITPSDVDNGSNDASGIASLEFLTITSGGELVLNGGFDNAFSNWTRLGGYITDNGGYAVLNDIGGSSDPGLKQVVNSFVIGETYTIKGDYKNQYGCCGAFIGQTAFGVDVDGNEIAALPNPGTNWSPFSVTFTATNTSHTIGFRGEINGTDTDIAIDNISIDGSIENITASTIDFDCSNVGRVNQVTLLVTDVNGNFSTQTAIVTVEDNILPTITLDGDTNVTVLFGDTFNDEGATAEDNCSAAVTLTNSIAIVSNVDTSVVGDYTVTYNVSDAAGNPAIEVTRTVQVVDTTKPVITLLGVDPQVLEVEDSYTELGATATDNYDDDTALTDAITINTSNVVAGTIGVYTVTYNVTDINGNIAKEVTRTVQVVDTTIPVITLVGNNPQIIDVNTPYVELTATASDNYDGDISVNIAVDYSAVDITTVGSYLVTYNVSDVSGNPAVQKTRTVFVLEHGKPWAKDDSYEVAKNSSNNRFKIIENDSYGIDGLNADHSISLSGTYTGTGGKLDLEDSTVKYTPRTGYVGVDGFSYIITDQNGDAFTGYVTINVLELTTPVANADYVDIIQNSSNNSIDVLANDSFGTDGRASVGSLTVSGTSTEAGSISIDSDKVMYTPAVGFFGDDSFSYTIKDATGETASATVTVRVTEKPLVRVPIAEKDAFSVGQNSSNNVMNVLADNGFGVDNFGSDGPIDGGLTFTSGLLEGESDLAGVISIDTKSTLSPLDDEIRYTPRVNFYGIDSFKYMITDATGDTSIVEVTIEVIEKDTPTAVADVISVLQDSGIISIDVLLNDSFGSDGEGTPALSVSGTSAEGVGITVNAEKVEYTPLAGFIGTDTFAYTITDSNGDSSIGTVTISINSLDTKDEPTAKNDLISVVQDSFENAINILGDNGFGSDTFGSDGPNATHPISLIAYYTDLGGKLDVVGTIVKYSPRKGFVGEDRFTYILTDSNGDASRAEVTVAVLEIDTPTAVADAVSVLQDSGITSVDVLANDSFGSDGAGITALSVSGTSVEGGVIAVNAGMIDYTPFAGFSGVDSFDYTITDGSGDTATGTVTILVESVYINDVPTAENDAVSVIQNSVDNMINILEDNGSGKDTFGSDGPNATHSISIIGTYTDLGGKLDLVGTSVKYSPIAGFIGVDTFVYIITDSNGDADRATVTVTVTAASPKAETTNDVQDVIAKNEFLVYPNPSNGYVKTTVYSTINTTATISLFDVTGKVIYSSVKQITTGKNEVDFNVNVKAGVLFLRVVSREVNFGTSKIVFK